MKTDASDDALSACLGQMHEGKLRPVAFYSRKLSSAEFNYEIYNKKLLTIIAVLKK